MRDSGRQQLGFSLLEVTIALVIFGFIFYVVSLSINVFNDSDTYAKNKSALDVVQKSLYTYVQVNNYLPCPDINWDGVEDRNGAPNFVCAATQGGLPYINLGVNPQDAWGSEYFYAINFNANGAGIQNNANAASYFGSLNPPVFNLTTPPVGQDTGFVVGGPAEGGNLTVCAETAGVACNNATNGANIIGFTVVAVIVSLGKNGQNSWDRFRNGNIAVLTAQEQENLDNDRFFWRAPKVSNVNNANYFDDQIVWITAYDIKHQMLKARQAL